MGTVLQPRSTVGTAGSKNILTSVLTGDSTGVVVKGPGFDPKSLLVIATPQYCSELYDTISKVEFSYPIYGMIADVVPPGGQRNGISYLWTSEPIELAGSSETLDSIRQARQAHETLTHGHETPEARGRFLSKGGEQWHLARHYAKLQFNNCSKNVSLQCASTIFETGIETLMLARLPGQDMELYGKMELRLPLNISFEQETTVPVLEKLENVSVIGNEPRDMYITACKDNVIKTINGKPASSFLEASLAAGLFLESPPPETTRFSKSKGDENPKNRSVYAVINGNERYKVIAGGGGWGSRAGMLVIDPDSNLRKGSSIEFWISTVPDISAEYELGLGDKIEQGKILFECVEPIQFLDSEGENLRDEVALENVFGAGSENQFFVDSKKYDVHGEFCAAVVE
ncbi:uncharacterized protein V1516DRAFT_630181 [Lipomyces oligophaga]|uniref:uncharacterized protein n=1 Tax=Lipomyces oligophaga TaxID=45792 RepID=UPI0034CD94DB